MRTRGLAGVTIDEACAAHRTDRADWASEQRLRDLPELAVLDAGLGREAHPVNRQHHRPDAGAS
ncbi:hypothetical protein [Streptomyces sp. Je 1-332]|uniref:hypothetical protein n=1 Tax=Streptomyces sp. Je 1-332 TaxID=3231270 RepID=UPI00345767B9